MREIVMLDRLDKRILGELQKDASLSNAELAERVGSSGPSCWRRIRQLEEAGVLGRTVRLANQALLGKSVNMICSVRMRTFEAESIAAFERFIADETRVMECFSMSGEWDYLLRVIASDVADYEQFLMHRLLKHPSVASASSHLALRIAKYETAIPTD
ncbi:Lrp/AsnC family transcriptional regulator [Sphingobium sp.]|uniref:Lrp/AsnC family transcriptional regulator n=1 Tax=Sphingobium sp. TaxID=1912891 RepID=UPI0026030DCF|nr:Lrp/AsnC family transcriptional regulator [Sphingobium sp.]